MMFDILYGVFESCDMRLDSELFEIMLHFLKPNGIWLKAIYFRIRIFLC